MTGRRRAAVLALVMSAVFYTPAVAAGDADDPGAIDADPREIRPLLDPAASPAAKAAAVERLAGGMPPGRTPIPVLILQARHGSAEARQRAQRTLGQVASRFLASTTPDAELVTTFRRDLRAALARWPAADPIRHRLDSPAPDAPARAVAALRALAESDPAGFAALSLHAKGRLVEGLERLTRAHADALADALDLVERSAVTRGSATRLIARAAAAVDPAVADRARRLLAQALIPDDLSPASVIDLAVALAQPTAETLVAPGPAVDVIEEDPRDVQPARPRTLVDRVARGELDAAGLREAASDVPAFLQAVTLHLAFAFAANDASEQLHLLRAVAAIVKPVDIDHQPELREQLLKILVPADPPREPSPRPTPADVAAAAAELLTGPRSRGIAEDALADAIVRDGRTPPAAALRALRIDPRAFARRLVPHLAAGATATRRATARTLATIGVPADDVTTRAALEACLRDADDDLRAAAADALDTPRARDLARVPPLLRDLRHPSPHTRQIAARKFQDLTTEPPDVAAALVRATDAGDMSTREGLCLALERAFATARPTRDVLAELAAPSNGDLTTRTCARAALRQLAPK